MRQIIFDFLRRWKWAYLISFVFHVAAMVLAWQEADKFIPFAILGGSAGLLMFDLFRSGGSRTILSLPVTSKQVARAWRFVGLEFPAAFFLVALVLSTLISWLVDPSSNLLNFERFLLLALFQTLLLGTLFFSLAEMPKKPAGKRNFKENLQGAFFGLLWGFSIPGCIFLSQVIPETFSDFNGWHWFVAGCLLLATVSGWFRAEALVLKRAQQLNRVRSSIGPSFGRRGDLREGRQSSAGRKNLAPIRGFGGIPFQFFHFALACGRLGLAIVLINWAAVEVISGRVPGNSDLRNTFSTVQIGFVVPFLAMIMAFTGLMQLRTLRGLPLSRAQIAGILVIWPMVFSAVFGLLVSLLHNLWFGGPFLWVHFVRAMAGAGGFLLAVPALLWFGFSVKGFIVILIVLPFMQFLQVFFPYEDATIVLPWWLPLVLIVVAFFASLRLLDSSRPWRQGAMRFNLFRRV